MLRHRVHLGCLPFFLNWALRVRRDARLYTEASTLPCCFSPR
jgi:hypothetical protein